MFAPEESENVGDPSQYHPFPARCGDTAECHAEPPTCGCPVKGDCHRGCGWTNDWTDSGDRGAAQQYHDYADCPYL